VNDYIDISHRLSDGVADTDISQNALHDTAFRVIKRRDVQGSHPVSSSQQIATQIDTQESGTTCDEKQ
jgi:hypothetical protein